MKRLELLIDMARKRSGNTRYDADSGVPQDVFVQNFNDAQDHLVMEVANIKTKFWKKSVVVPVVSGQVEYDYPEGCYLQHIDTIAWSLDGIYYTPMDKCITKEEVSVRIGYAFSYIPYHDNFHLNPPIGNGFLKVTFIWQPPQVQKRSGQISALTLVGQTLSALTVNVAEVGFDPTEINMQNFLCVVGRDGNVKAKGIAYDSVSSVTGVFTMSSVVLVAGQTLAVGDYICVGLNVVNIPQWPDICEGFLIKYAQYLQKYGDSSSWTKAVQDDMDKTFGLLIGSFASLSDDITDIAITNIDYLGL